ncbi:MAG TPA: hypothetical protein VIV60_06805, partial [Polyangiaceae bacterium]
MNPESVNLSEKSQSQGNIESALPQRSRVSGLLASLVDWFGFGDDTQAAAPSLESDYDRFESAVEFKRWGDQVISQSDMTVPGYHYVVAASLYANCLEL